MPHGQTVGQPRRGETADSLRGANAIQPTPVPVPNLQAPNVAAPDVQNSQAAKVARSISAFTGEQFQAATNIDQEMRYLDGQMAAAQGQSMDDLEIEGDKWAMSGYRAIEAQSLTATLLAAQQEMLRQVDFEDDPEEYRAKIVARLATQLDGLDPKTAQLVRKQMAAQMPALVAQHTSANMQYQEAESYRTLEYSMDIMSKDDTQIAAMLSNASGDGEGFSGLSRDRRESAVAQGVVRAFEAGNPLAYARLKSAGVLDEFSTGQQQLMRNAEDGYQTQMRQELNTVYVAEIAALETEIASGKYSGDVAMMKLSEIMASHGMEIRAAEGKAAYTAGKDANELNRSGTALLIREAGLRGDFEAIASLSFDALGWVESKNDPNARGPVIMSGANRGDQAIGEFQIMPKTIRDPGYGVKPGNPADPVSVRRASKDYWTAMVAGSSGGYGLPWEAGDLEAAAVAYNAGPGNATKWIEAGRDYSVLPDRAQTEPYAKALVARAGASDISMSADARQRAAQAAYDATAKAVDLEGYEAITLRRVDLNEEFQSGALSIPEFVAADRQLNDEYNVVRTSAESNAMISEIETFRADSASMVTDERREVLDTQYEVRRAALDSVLADDRVTVSQKSEAIDLFGNGIREMYADAGVIQSDFGNAAMVKELGANWNEVMRKGRDAQLNNDLITRARSNGSVGDLSPQNRAKAWAAIREETAQAVADQASAVGAPPEQQSLMQYEATVDSWRNASEVDPVVANGNSAIVNGRLLADDGKASPAVVDTINRYLDLKATDPYLSQTFFSTEDARVRAEMLAAKGAEDVSEGILNYMAPLADRDRFNDPLSKEARIAMAVSESIQVAQTADVGFFQGMFTSAAISQMWNTTGMEFRDREAAAQEVFAPILEQQLQTLAMRHDIPPKDLLQVAVSAVKNQTSFLGGSVVVYESGNDFLRQALGGDADDFVSRAGVEDDILSEYMLEEAANIPGLEGITEFTMIEAGFIGRSGRNIIDAIPQLLGFEGFFDPMPMGILDTQGAMSKGLRPYKVMNINGNTAVRFLKQDGQMSEFVVIDPALAGALWKRNNRQSATE